MSLLQLAELPPVTWARFGRFGEGGSYGYQMDASGTDIRNRLMHRELIPATSAVSLQTRVRVKSSLITSNPAFEGLAVKHRGFQLNGSAPSAGSTQKWDSQPESQGKRAWISGSTSGEYLTFNFVNDIDPRLGIDYVTWELELRAASGSVEIDNVECRYYYGRIQFFDTPQAQTFHSGYSIETLRNGLDTDLGVVRWLKYLQVREIEITKGQNILANLSAAMRGRSYEYYADASGARIPGETGLMFRFRRKGTDTYDFMDIGGGYSTTDNKWFNVTKSTQRQARYNYDQVELLGYNEPEPTDTAVTYGADLMFFEDVECELTIGDFTGPSQ